jgi:mRNA-degrading endonuclease RelE of RelBE toxin-antitoxin system
MKCLAETKPHYEIKFTKDAKDDVGGLDGSVKGALKKVLEKKLCVNPQDYGTPLRAPLVNFHKHEFANHRIVYRIYPEQNLVVVCAVGSRKGRDAADVYTQLQKVVDSGRLAAQVVQVLTVLGITKPK